MYLRELPEPLMTIRLSNTFTTIFIDVPPQYRLRALQSAILLLPDENREVLQDSLLNNQKFSENNYKNPNFFQNFYEHKKTLLFFLSDIAACKEYNQMPASNLAVCFAPSLFQIAMNNPKFKFKSALSRRTGNPWSKPDGLIYGPEIPDKDIR